MGFLYILHFALAGVITWGIYGIYGIYVQSKFCVYRTDYLRELGIYGIYGIYPFAFADLI